MSPVYREQRAVAFSDTDGAAVVHFAKLLVYVEDAEHRWLKELGFPVFGQMNWPRVHIECDYLKPCRFEDQVEVCLGSIDVGTSSLKYDFCLSIQGDPCATGKIVVVRLDAAGERIGFSQDERDRFFGEAEGDD